MRSFAIVLLIGVSACPVAPSSDAGAEGGGLAAGGTSGTGGGTVSGGGAAGGTVAGGSAGGTTAGGSAGGASAGGGVAAARDGGLNPLLAGLADNTALDLGAFTCTDPGEGAGICRRVTDYSGLAVDEAGGRLLMFGGGHSTTMTDSIFMLPLDGDLRWRELYPPTPCSSMVTSNVVSTTGAWRSGGMGPYPRPLAAHTYDLLGFAPAQNEFVMLSRLFNGGYCSQAGNDVGGPVAHFSLNQTQWTYATVRGGGGVAIEASEFDPMSGSFVLLGNSGLTLYDPATKARRQPVDTFNGATLKNSQGMNMDMGALGYANHLVYSRHDDTFYYFTRTTPVRTYALKLNRAAPASSTLDLVATTGPTSTHGEPGYAYDTKNRIIGGAVQGGQFFALDPATRTWTSRPIARAPGSTASVGAQAFHALGYDPLNNVFVFVTDYDSGSRTWAYRYRN